MVVAIVTSQQTSAFAQKLCVGRMGTDLGKVHLRVHQRTAMLWEALLVRRQGRSL